MLAYNPAANPLNQNDWSFPLLEIIHIAGFVFSVGTIALVDLRMLGLAFVRRPSSRLAQDLSPWTLAGLAVMLTSGPLIFTSKPGMYLQNSSFRFKMGVLFVAVVYNYTVHAKIARAPDSPSVPSICAALVSLVLWVSVVFAGIFIAFV